MRLNRFLAGAGVCSRRDADRLIASGAVKIDGRHAAVGAVIDPQRQRVTVNGRAIGSRSTKPSATTIVLHKPRGVITTMRDERGRRSVADLLPPVPRYAPVGRLDADSTGVLLLTTDGELSRVLTHPSYGVEKRYRVRTDREPTAHDRAALGAIGVKREPDGSARFDILLREGKNRQVRRMCAQRGLRVLDLERIAFGPVSLRGLGAGKTRPLTTLEEEALERLRRRAGGVRAWSPSSPSQKRAVVQPTE